MIAFLIHPCILESKSYKGTHPHIIYKIHSPLLLTYNILILSGLPYYISISSASTLCFWISVCCVYKDFVFDSCLDFQKLKLSLWSLCVYSLGNCWYHSLKTCRLFSTRGRNCNKYPRSQHQRQPQLYNRPCQHQEF